MTVKASKHCVQRLEERAVLKRESAEISVQKAFDKGLTAYNCKAIEKKYLQEKSSDLIIAVAYNGLCYIFDRESHICITAYTLPRWFGRDILYEGKIRVRHPQKYYRFFPDSCDIYDKRYM